VDTIFTISKSKTSTVTVQSKSVSPIGETATSGSISKTISGTLQFPTRTESSLDASGVYAQQEATFSVTEYTNIKNSNDKYSTVRISNYKGGSRFGGSPGGNSFNFDTTSGTTVAAGTIQTVTHVPSLTFSNQASTSQYGLSIGLSVTLNTTTQNTWKFTTKTGMGYKEYKFYGKYYNLIAK